MFCSLLIFLRFLMLLFFMFCGFWFLHFLMLCCFWFFGGFLCFSASTVFDAHFIDVLKLFDSKAFDVLQFLMLMFFCLSYWCLLQSLKCSCFGCFAVFHPNSNQTASQNYKNIKKTQDQKPKHQLKHKIKNHKTSKTVKHRKLSKYLKSRASVM